MKLDSRFEELARVLATFGIEPSNWKLERRGPSPERRKILERLERGVVLESLDGPDGVTAGPGGLLTHRGTQVVIYIKDSRNWQASRRALEQRPEDFQRYHVAECKTIAEMRREGRFERYVMTNRSDGKFLVDCIDHATGESEQVLAELKLCQNCWKSIGDEPWAETRASTGGWGNKWLNVGGWREKWLSFSLSGFLAAHATFFNGLPSRWDRTSPPDAYVRDWPRISRERRKAAGWRCEKCGVDLSGAKGLLQCHHRSGVVTDNSPENLAVLCIECHAAEPQHGHMKVPEEALRIIRAARGDAESDGEDEER